MSRMSLKRSRGPLLEEEDKEDAVSSTVTAEETEEDSENYEEESDNGEEEEDECEEITEEEYSSDEESPAYLQIPSTLTAPSKALASTPKRQPPQLIPISEMNLSINTPCTSSTATNEETQPQTRKRSKSQRESPEYQPITFAKRTLPLPPIPGSTGRAPYRFQNGKRVLNRRHAVDQRKLHLGWFCICSASFAQQGYLTEHIKYFTSEPKFLCKWCPLRYTSLTGLKAHMISAHKKNPFFAGARGCGDCGMIFKNREEHKAHRLANHPRWTERLKLYPHSVDETLAVLGRFRCLCGRDFGKAKYLIAHVRKYANPTGFQCDTCPSVFKSFGQLQSHSRKVHKKPAQDNKRFGCALCAHLCQNRKELQQHMQREHDVIQWYQAAKTEEEMADPATRQREHGIAPTSSKGTGSVVARCLCGSGYPSKRELLQHIKKTKVRPRVPFKCPYCEGEFVQHARLARHIRGVHQVNYEALGCSICGTTWSSRLALRRHQDNDHGIERRTRSKKSN